MTTGKSTPQSPARQRKTRQLEAVLSAVRGMTDFQSAAEIFTKLQLNGTRVGLATVYRNLAALAEDGVLDTVKSADGTTLYRECESSEHHHHLVCRSCGKTEEFHLKGLEETLNEMGREMGFSALSHTVELTGLCSKCSAKK
ncbi:Fur family transcriptional regulator [Mobiluncus massiliensis]|uniref:Fur family transcriptional regulator n=1 Tax=uncultured Mobiluncus sp. TaxID=293425 RepID=UPI0024ADA5BF|nr:transcriptional repressor [Mobiluncus sp. Marseille-Q7826]